MKATKKGFTLIELMVVIVIIGILAAIAIPKLFGMTAKAKASEVGPAAGTWSKLQQAFFMEKSGYGGWDQIAYRAPGATIAGGAGVTGYFTYGAAANNMSAASAGQTLGTAHWSATTSVKLGDCSSGQGWSAGFVSVTNDSPTAAAPNNSECGGLTPNFTTLK